MNYKFDNVEHVHTINGEPLCGTSTVMGVAAKVLTWWAAGLAVQELGWTPKKDEDGNSVDRGLRMIQAHKRLEEIKPMSGEEYLDLLDKAYAAHSKSLKDSATAGTDLHAEAEKWVKSVMDLKEIDPHPRIKPFVAWCKENVEGFLYSEIHCYSIKMWTGGISDCGAWLKNGKRVVFDFKSSKEVYPSQLFQAAGYAMQLAENGGFDAQGNKKLDPFMADDCAVVPFGGKSIPVFSGEIETIKEGFLGALALYKATERMKKVLK